MPSAPLEHDPLAGELARGRRGHRRDPVQQRLGQEPDRVQLIQGDAQHEEPDRSVGHDGHQQVDLAARVPEPLKLLSGGGEGGECERGRGVW
jgi:hypothetical protein